MGTVLNKTLVFVRHGPREAIKNPKVAYEPARRR